MKHSCFRLVVVLTLLVGLARIYAADEVGSIAFSGTESAVFDTDDPLLNNTDVEKQSGDLLLPVWFSGDKANGLLAQLQYQTDQFNVEAEDRDLELDVHLLALRLIKFWTVGKWKHRVVVIPGVYTDFESVDGDDFLVTGGYIANHSLSDKVNYDVGLVYGQSFGEPVAFPFLAYNVKPNARWSLSLGVPRTNMTYFASEQLEFFGAVRPSGGQWHVEPEDGDPNGVAFDFQEQVIRAGAGVRRALRGPFWLEAEVGMEAARELTTVIDGNVTERVALDNAGYAQIKISFRK